MKTVDNRTSVAGIFRNRNLTSKWTVFIVNRHVGSCETFDEAVLLRLATEQCLGWDISLSPAYHYAINHKLIKG